MNEDRNRVLARERMRRMRARKTSTRNLEWAAIRKPGPRPRQSAATIPASPGADRGYALDFSSPVRHVATELERAGTRGATIHEMALSYDPTIASDLARIRLQHGLESNFEARRFLVDRAVSALGKQVRGARRTGAYRLAVPFDDLRYEGSEIARTS